MKVVLSNQSELPIYAQIREQIKEQISNGQIAEGTLLPSIRQLAKDLGISVITTTRAYRELESGGYIASVQGKGSIVLKRDNKVIREQYRCQMEEHLDAAIEASKKLDMTDEELVEALQVLQKQHRR
ncbi:transcriptional regulator, GntR family [Marvinbryantia formatexigens DSM 14469]|uniref:Transcriptional regulator, GntR family n=1 Tax=Marvinbryantia formatexigens DSM 14469 TaxID=478749 RepID=C6LED1_9FIRM|nr:GntR family transcriptional regulator [Marvinbryantia formatexigens]EET60914.1 transcriptional regulator, GntR family [Marvinbryantia formatexigens DSM 14469]UWO24787.1 GntR family transcriptional regulator [Marvinbryantia formatexigens DSM 14469]SDF23364.1 transcriptional regulator, GntR family [Marvinbryantia formatexigens]